MVGMATPKITDRDHRIALLSYVSVKWVMVALRWWLHFKARLAGKSFYCSALAGRSHYNIGIGADLSVTCNGQDREDEGRLGNLNTHTIQEIFSGATITRFREALAKGRLPIHWCTRCSELKTVPKQAAQKQLTNWRLPTHFMVENY